MADDEDWRGKNGRDRARPSKGPAIPISMAIQIAIPISMAIAIPMAIEFWDYF